MRSVLSDPGLGARIPAGALLVLVLAAGPVQAGQWDYDRTPILFLHGYFVISSAGDATWANFSKRASQDGWPAEYLRTPSFRDVRGCNDEHVEEIAEWVQELTSSTGFDRIDVVCHSMGCLNLLSYLKSDHCGVQRVRRVVMLAGAMHGTTVACLDPFSCGAKHMCIGSRDGAWRANEFLAALNACDETPGDIRYTCLWSEYDEIIVPPSGSQLQGARNIELDTPWVEHGGIFLCDECWDRTREALLEGTGLNEDGPGWECLPEHCRPPPDSPTVDPAPDPDVPSSGEDVRGAGPPEGPPDVRDPGTHGGEEGPWETGEPWASDRGLQEGEAPGSRGRLDLPGGASPETGTSARSGGSCAQGGPGAPPVPFVGWILSMGLSRVLARSVGKSAPRSREGSVGPRGPGPRRS